MKATPAGVVARLRGSAAAGSTLWGLFDQALSSFTNFVLSIAVARQVTPDEFGAYSIAFATYLIALTVSRAVATDPLTIRYSARDVDAWRSATSRATGTAIAVGFASGLASLVAGIAIGGDIGAALVPLAVGLPVLLLQDAWRYAFFAGRRGRDAFVNDLVWTLALGVALIGVIVSGAATVTTLVIAWAIGGAVGGIVGVAQARVVPRLAVRAWLGEHRDIAPRMAVEGVILSGAQQILLVAISVIAGLASVAAVRAGQVLMNALHIATYGIYLAIVPEAVRLLTRSAAALRRLCLAVAAGLSAITAAWTVVLLLLPEPVGRALLGETWPLARAVIVPMALVTIGGAIQIGGVVGLRAFAAAGRSLRARIASSALMFVGGIAGAILGGAIGTAWGMAIGVLAGSLVWWYELWVEMRIAGEHRAAEGPNGQERRIDIESTDVDPGVR